MNQEIRSETVGNAIVQSSLGSFFAKASGVLSSLIIFRSLDPATYGVWRLALALTALLLGLLTALSAIVAVEAIRSLPEAGQKTGLILWRGFVRITLLCAVLLCGLGIVFVRPVAAFLKVPDTRLVVLALILVFFWLLKSHVMTWFTISYQFDKQLRLQVIESVAYVSLLAFFLLVRDDGALGLGLANVFVSGLISVVSAPLLLKGLKRCPRSSLKQEVVTLLRLLRQHGKWALVSDILKDYLDAGRIWLLGFFLGPAAVGLYGLADSLFGHIISLINVGPAISASLPRFVSDRERLTAAMAHAARVGSLVSCGVFVFSWVTVPFILPWVFPKFIPAIPLYLIISGALLAGGVGVVLGTMYPALRLQKTLFSLLMIRVILSFGFLYVFLPRIGIWALGIELLLGNYLFVWMRFHLLRKTLSIHKGFFAFCAPRVGDLQEVYGFLHKKLAHSRVGAVLKM